MHRSAIVLPQARIVHNSPKNFESPARRTSSKKNVPLLPYSHQSSQHSKPRNVDKEDDQLVASAQQLSQAFKQRKQLSRQTKQPRKP